MTPKEQLDGVYKERNRLVSALSKVFPAHLQKHDEADESWERDWMNIVCIHVPTKKLTVFGDAINALRDTRDRWTNEVEQVTWHIHDSDLPMFAHLALEPNHWDGHDTEEKYQRLERITP